MNGIEALGLARMLIDEARRDGRYPVGVVETYHRRSGRRPRPNFGLVYGKRLEVEIVEADRLVGFIDENTSDSQLASQILEVA